MPFFSNDNFPPYPAEVNTKVRKENDFVIKEINLTAYNGEVYDLSPIRLDLNIYEDLFSNSVSGDLSVIDANDLFQLMPLIGEEKLKIVFTRPEPGTNGDDDSLLPDFAMEFRVYYVSNRQLYTEKSQFYILHFISPDFITNLKQKITKSFKALPYSEMAKIAFDLIGSDKPLLAEETMHEHDYTAPNIYPFEFINCIAARSTSAAGNGEAYIFFADYENYHFCSIGSLLIQPPAISYTYQLNNILENTKGETFYRDRTIDMDLKSLHQYGFSNTFNVLKNLVTGMYASRLVTYDIVRQIWTTLDFDYKENFDQFKHLDKHDTSTDGLDALGAPTSFIKFLPTNKDHDSIPWIAEKEPGILPNRVEDYTQHRYSQFRQIDNAKILISVSGDPRRKVGQIIEFRLPQALSNVCEQHPEELDKYLQGKYLITSLVHRLKKNGYYLEMEIVKDTFFTEIEHINPDEVYKDIY